MADYEKMYAVLCSTIDEVIDSLDQIPAAQPITWKLRQALLTSEDIYIDTSPYLIEEKRDNVIPLRTGKHPDFME